MLKSSVNPKSLKQRNQPQLILFAVVNIVGLLLLTLGAENLAKWIELIKQGDVALLVRAIAFPAVGSMIVGLINWTIPKYWKEVLIFWHRGVRSLPSSEAFTKIGPADSRIDMSNLSQRLGELPIDYGKQSALWYTTYRKHRSEASVEDANSAYLLYREMMGLVPVILTAMIAVNIWQASDWKTLGFIFSICVLEFILVLSAARNAGCRLVANVLALESSSAIKKVQTPAETEPPPTVAPKPRRARAPKTKEAGGS